MNLVIKIPSTTASQFLINAKRVGIHDYDLKRYYMITKFSFQNAAISLHNALTFF